MWSVREALERFIQSLELTQKQRDEVSRQHTLVRAELRERLRTKTDFLSGSYSRNTAIRPLHDIDLFIVLKDVTSSPPESPDAVLKQVRKALKDAWTNKEFPILQRHSVHMEFTGTGIEFDVVPAFELSGQQSYFIPERDKGQWIRTNPRLHQERSTEANERAGKKLKPLLKAVKHWRRQQSSLPLRSFHLEVMSYDALPQPPKGYPEGLEELFSSLSKQVLRPCRDPALLGPDVDEGMSATQREAASQMLASAAGKMRRVLEEERTNPAQAHSRLRSLFGEMYRERG